MVNLTRYSQGEVKVKHKGHIVNTSVGSKEFDNLYANSDTIFEFKSGIIPLGFEHRPDLISDTFYGTPGKWWLLMVANGIIDPFEELNANDRILIPKL